MVISICMLLGGGVVVGSGDGGVVVGGSTVVKKSVLISVAITLSCDLINTPILMKRFLVVPLASGISQQNCPVGCVEILDRRLRLIDIECLSL